LNIAESQILEHDTDVYYRLLDEQEKLLWETGRMIHKGDQFLTPENDLYEVTEIDEESHIARAELVERVELPHLTSDEIRNKFYELTGLQIDAAQQERGLIGIYFTHNAESYVPSDGTESIEGKGGIHRVGNAFREALEERGITVVVSDRLHLPHDRGAYRRSRETVLEILQNAPDAIYDIHRNAAPAEEYENIVNGERIAQVMFVVGRQNPNFEVNKEFALSLKNVADEIHEGLIRGVFFGQGDYNQDLSPVNLLLEVGGHLNKREDAERGITLFADVVDNYFYVGEGRAAGERKTAFIIAVEIIVLTFIGAAVFFILNEGGITAAKKKFDASIKKIKRKLQED